ncbi:cytochrome P450 2J6 isoform X1 [Ixodes scapularis]|uniref:cytochrome P450 2J6 isoform X1 n=1 Tax=Ixodes scapularis TaxID=6945 RepID=UPI001C384DCC|nr:cytochrome P450 2J6 isoform X1 [Ixodes scapularis]
MNDEMHESYSPSFVWKVFREDYSSLATDIALGLVITLVIGALCLKKGKARIQDRPLPPGPTGVPVLGYLPFLGSSPQVTYKKLAAKYGPIVRVKLGSEDVVVLNDLDSIKEGLNKDAVLARPTHFLLRSIGVDGIATMNGQRWVDNRRFCMHVLRDLGFGKKSMEEHIKEEIAQLYDVLKSWNGTPGKIENVITSSVSNNITALVFGERFSYDDPRRLFLDKRASGVSRNGSFTSPLDFFPALRKLLSYLPSSRSSIVRALADSMLDFIRKEADQRSKTLSPDVNRDFIDAYLKKINESNGTNQSFNLRTLMGNALNLFGAGTNTVRASIEWNLLYCARDPEGVQRKLQQEVDNIVGRERAPEWEDRHRMPYTMAFIWEMLRWRTPTPLGLIRMAERDTTMGGFHVPAGTVVLSNFWAVHHDPEVWEHPFDFDPTRFLNADHTVLLPKPAAFIPFSTGRRMCPGETLAIMEIFIYLTTLLQKFTVLPKEGETISMDIHEGITNIPLHSQELRFLPR